MNTLDQALTESEAKKLKDEMAKMQVESAMKSIETMKQEVEWLNEIVKTLKNDKLIADELIIPMHNLFSIVPEEQYQFLGDMRSIFDHLPVVIKNIRSVSYLIERLGMMKEDDLNTKANQPTDLSQYWSAYRRVLYMHGVIEATRPRRIQMNMRKKLLKIAEETLRKRTQGISTAELIVNGRASLV